MKAPRTALATAIAALTMLIAVPMAGAAAWQGSTPISDAAASAGDKPPAIALGANGDAAAGWWQDDGGIGHVMVARRPAGGSWSAPAPVATTAGLGSTNRQVVVGVDANGTVTAGWTTVGIATTASIATWLPGAATPSVQNLVVGSSDPSQIEDTMFIESLAVNAAGDAVIAGTTGNGTDMILGYRHGAAGAFMFTTKHGSGSIHLITPKTAINAAGTAVTTWRWDGFSHLAGSVHTAADADWGPNEDISLSANGPTHSVALDAAGNIFAAFTAGPGGADPSQAVFTALRPPSGGWALSSNLSPASGLVASDVTVAVTPGGAALLTWRQGTAPLDTSIQARPGSTGTGLWGATEQVNDAASGLTATTIAPDGRAMVAWERANGLGFTGQGRIREPNGVWGSVQPLSGQHSNTIQPGAAADGLGDLATISTVQDAVNRVFVTAYDAAPPNVSAVALAGSPLAGEALTLAVTATDAWSAIPSAPWSFGDGSTGAGLSIVHAYANAGSYAAEVVVNDASGNATARQVAVGIAALQSALTQASFSAKWKASRVKGTLVVKGAVPRAGTYVITASLGKSAKVRASVALAAGAFSTSLKLPAKLLPGTYHVTLAPPFLATQVTPAARDARLKAPPEGVVGTVALSGRNNGPAARTLRNASTIWATFRFAAVPKGALKLTWYRAKNGKRHKIGSTTKSASKKVVSYLRLGGTLHGTFTAVLTRKGKVIAQGSVKAQ